MAFWTTLLMLVSASLCADSSYETAFALHNSGDEGKAAYFAYRAVQEMPRSVAADALLAEILASLDLPPPAAAPPWKRLLAPHFFLSLNERMLLLTLTTLALTGAILWKKGIKTTIVLFLVPAISLFVSQYIAPIEGVVLKAVYLREEATSLSSVMMKKPLLPGTKLQVVRLTEDLKWAEAINGQKAGFVQLDHLAILPPD